MMKELEEAVEEYNKEWIDDWWERLLPKNAICLAKLLNSEGIKTKIKKHSFLGLDDIVIQAKDLEKATKILTDFKNLPWSVQHSFYEKCKKKLDEVVE